MCGGRQDASPAVKATVVSADSGANERLRIIDGRFVDSRWVAGTWVLSEFASAGGVMDYSAWEKVTPPTAALTLDVLRTIAGRNCMQSGAHGKRQHCPCMNLHTQYSTAIPC